MAAQARICVGLMAGGAALSLDATAGARVFDIPAQEARTGIPAFARQAEVQILAPADRLRGRSTNAVSGDLDERRALERLIRGTDLRIKSDDGRTIILGSHAGPTRTALQVATPTPAAQARSAPPPAALPEPAAAPEQPDIVVTAQRRSEKLRDVPISVTALSAQALASAGVVNTRDLGIITPGLRIEAVGIYVQPAIRGITTTQTGPGNDPNVATYLDGVYQQTQVGAIYELPDIKQIEVLKGPQGTLFGRNATGGAILINTLDPDLDRLTGKLNANYGRFNSYRFSGFVSGPIVSDTVAASVSAQLGHDGPYQHDLLRGDERRGGVRTGLVRGKLRVRPWNGADFVLSGLYTRRNDRGSLSLTSLNGNNSANRNPALAPVVIPRGPYDFASDIDSFARTTLKSGNLRGEITVGPGQLTTITAHTDVSSRIFTDGDGSPRFISTARAHAISKTTTQEFVYALDPIGIVRPIVGAFFYWNRGGFDPLLVNGTVQARYTVDQSRAQAAFGELTWTFTDRLKLITGLRYSHERRLARGLFTPNTTVRPATIPLLGKKSFDAATPRASLLYKASRDVNVYATYSRGFKSGVFNSAGLQAAPVRPETVDSYEIGLKAAAGGGVSFNLAGFYMDYRNLQVQALQIIQGQNTSLLDNAAKARIYGIEFDGAWRVSDALRLSAGATWLDAKYKSFPTAAINVPNPDGRGGNVTVVRDVSGNRMIRAPKFAGNVSATYGVDVGTGRVEANGSLFYSSRIYYEASNRVSQPSYVTLNAKLAWRSADGLEIGVFGRNLTNEAVISSTQIGGFGDLVSYNLPRTFGIQAGITF